MNIIIFLSGLIFIVLTSIIILNDKRVNIANIKEEENLVDDINMVNSHPVKRKIYFENILENINSSQEILSENRSTLLDSSNKELVLIDDNYDYKGINDHQEKAKDKIQNYTYERIIELSNSGLKPEEIAKITQKGIREVEIILKFQNKKSNSQNSV